MTSFLGVLVSMFGVSFLVHHFMKLMGFADSQTNEIIPVEVVNTGDFGRR
ncbi:hypothetical protein [Paenibacillus ehimensis]|uniref:Uncharacterized protein n=1 Tax=Paenibacillus ehimensis TaxID=79264 RepID=A0ABT8VM79_9BACL|nr:hypothetical protein [Paenibacillus ehimensis]MDO3682093.1 hypothetical protein [Paenibacillus ehimensis]